MRSRRQFAIAVAVASLSVVAVVTLCRWAILTPETGKPVEKLNWLVGLSEVELEGQLGKPDLEEIIFKDDLVGEFRAGVTSHLSSTGKNAAKELQWKHDGYYMTAWLVKDDRGAWLCIEAIQWDEEVRF